MQIHKAASLKPYNTLSLEAQATALAQVETPEELATAIDWAQAQGLQVIPLGEGSNIVLAGKLEAVWLQQRSEGIKVLNQKAHSVQLRVDAGHDWHRLVE